MNRNILHVINFYANDAYSYIVNHQNRENVDVYVVSYPKCGRTWHRLLVGSYIAIRCHSDVKRAIKPTRLGRAHRLPRVDYTHNNSDFMNYLVADDPQVADPSEWQGKKVIFLTRDICDALTSAYFHAHFRTNRFGGTLSEFLRDHTTGAEKLLTAFNRWYANRDLASDYLHIRYEDMHADAEGILRKTLDFAGFSGLAPDAIRQAVAFCQASNMRKLEQKNFFRSNAMRLPSSGRQEGAKIRNAKIGDYLNHMTEEDIAFISDLERTLGNPFVNPISTDS